MFGFWRKKETPRVKTVKVPLVQTKFTATVDTKGGPLQDALQREIATILRAYPAVQRGYLALLRVEGQTDEGVMVALGSTEGEDQSLILKISEACAPHGLRGPVRVLFLSEENEQNLSVGLKPFYSRGDSGGTE